MLPLTEAAQAILDDDHGAIDDQAEVQRSQAHQVGRYPVLHHAGDGHQHGNRDHGRRDQCRTDIAQQQEKNHDYQQGSLEEVLLDRGNTAIHQLGAVINRTRTDPFR